MFFGSPKDYFEILKVSYETIKSTDQSAQILLGGVTGALDVDEGEALPFWEEVFQFGAANYFDISNVKYSTPTRVQRFRDFLRYYGVEGKPIWSTSPNVMNHIISEYGAIRDDVPSVAEALVSFFEDAFQSGVEKIFVPREWGRPEETPAMFEAIRIIEGSNP